MSRLLVSAVLLVFGFGFVQAQAQTVDIPPVTISGGNLPFVLHLAPADADSFSRRLNQLPRLEERPTVHGDYYLVTTPYWQETVRIEDDDEEDEPVSEEARYYPEGGYVRAMLGDEAVWMVLNLRQREIVDRYVRHALAGGIGERPSTLQVLQAASEAGEPFVFEMGGELIGSADVEQLLTNLTSANPSPILEEAEGPPAGDGAWLIATLPEGRSLRYFYDGVSLTEGLGTERYDATSVADLLDGMVPGSQPVLEEQGPAGSLLWWPVMAGGGLVAIGAAAWLWRAARHRERATRRTAATGLGHDTTGRPVESPTTGQARLPESEIGNPPS